MAWPPLDAPPHAIIHDWLVASRSTEQSDVRARRLPSTLLARGRYCLIGFELKLVSEATETTTLHWFVAELQSMGGARSVELSVLYNKENVEAEAPGRST